MPVTSFLRLRLPAEAAASLSRAKARFVVISLCNREFNMVHTAQGSLLDKAETRQPTIKLELVGITWLEW